MKKIFNTILIIVLITTFACNVEKSESDKCNFGETLKISPDIFNNDSVDYYEISIPIEKYESDKIYSCIIGKFDTIMQNDICELKTISSYDSIPDRFIKDSSFVTMYKSSDINAKVLTGFIRTENEKTDRFRIFEIVLNEN